MMYYPVLHLILSDSHRPDIVYYTRHTFFSNMMQVFLADTGEVNTLTLAVQGSYSSFGYMAHFYKITLYLRHSLNKLEIQAGDANTVYAMVMKVLTDNKVPLDKVIGICSDGASTMQGLHKGVCIQLAKRIRELRQGVIQDMRSLDHTRSIDSFHANKGTA